MHRLRIQHRTEYRFSNPVSFNAHRLLLRPREGHDIRIESSRLDISPAYNIQWHRDVLNNSLAVVTFTEASDTLRITSDVIIQHYDQTPLSFMVESHALRFPFQYSFSEQIDLSAFRRPLSMSDQHAIQEWLLQFNLQGMETTHLLVTLNQAIHNQFKYGMREEPGVHSPAQTLFHRSGSCRDYATLLMETCRYLGFASRFVSGYLHSPATEAGNGATHAWVEIYIPGTGWQGFDPTTGLVTGSDHIAAAVARDPETVPPVSGSFTGSYSGRPNMLVDVQVNLIND